MHDLLFRGMLHVEASGKLPETRRRDMTRWRSRADVLVSSRLPCVLSACCVSFQVHPVAKRTCMLRYCFTEGLCHCEPDPARPA